MEDQLCLTRSSANTNTKTNMNTNTNTYMPVPGGTSQGLPSRNPTVCHHPPRPKMLKYKWKSSHLDPDLSFEVPHNISQLQKSKNLLTSLLKFIACVNVAQKDGGVIQLPTLRNSFKCASCRLSICRSSVFSALAAWCIVPMHPTCIIVAKVTLNFENKVHFWWFLGRPPEKRNVFFRTLPQKVGWLA